MHIREPKSYPINLSNVSLMAYDWPGEGDPILLVHATGFHARCWDQIVALLPNRHVIAVDLRCHGQSEKTKPPYAWPLFADDLVEFVESQSLENVLAVGHSMGGHLVTRVAAIIPQRLSGLLLLDPVIMSPTVLKLTQRFEGEHPAAKRRNQWSSAQEMFDQFKDKSPFNEWNAEVLKDYCNYGLTLSNDGNSYRLACPPKMEAAMYKSTGGDDVHRLLHSVTIPVSIVRARGRMPSDKPFDFRPSPTWPELVDQFPNAIDRQLTMSHFFPMEDPKLVAAEIVKCTDNL